LAEQFKLNILNKKRRSLLPLLKEFKEEFYLAGGTALALQVGHRRSEDFDFFTSGIFDLQALQEKTRLLLGGFHYTVTQLEENTYSIIIDEEVKVSFFKIEQEVILPFIHSEWFRLCNELEIGAMKIAALLRAAFRDYVDLYFLLKKYKLREFLSLCEKKYSGFEKSVYLKALLSYDDIEQAPIQYLEGYEKTPDEIFSFVEKQTRQFLLYSS